MRKPADHALQEKVRLDRSMLLWSIGFWLLVPICWVPVIAADSTPGEKDLGLGVLAMACVSLVRYRNYRFDSDAFLPC